MKLQQILSNVSHVTRVPIRKIKSETREGNVVVARQMYCYFARKHTDHISEDIGMLINRDYATVLYSAKTMHHRIKFEKSIKKLYIECLRPYQLTGKSHIYKILEYKKTLQS